MMIHRSSDKQCSHIGDSPLVTRDSLTSHESRATSDEQRTISHVSLNRQTHIAPKIVFLDGLTGTGKTMMGPLLGSLRRVELGRLEHHYEYLCALDFLKKIDPDAGEYMIKMYADLAMYNTMIARETNFRVNDLSGIFKNPKTLKYIRRLFIPDGEAVLERIRREQPILQIISHQALGIMNLAFRAFGNRLRVVHMVRHPLYLLEHWHSYIDRHGTDARDFTIWINHQGTSLPWFAAGWEERYAKASSMDKVIYSIEWLTRQTDKMTESLSPSQKQQILTIPFEHFVLNPNPFLESITKLLETETTSQTKSILKKQKCPRALVGAGLSRDIYKRYGWKQPPLGATEKDQLSEKFDFANRLASKEAMTALSVLCKNYEARYGLWF